VTYRPTIAIVVLAMAIAIFLIGPSLLAVPASLTDQTYLSLPKKALSFQHYERFFADAAWLNAFLLSLSTATTAAAIATVAGVAFSIGIWSLSGRTALLMRAVVLLPLAIPGIVTAIALFLAWTYLGIYDTAIGVILVQLLVGLPFVVVTTTTGLALFDKRQIMAARSFGAGPWRIVLRIILPNLKLPILSGFVLALVSGWDESVATLFVTGFSVQVLPRKIWDSLRYDVDPIVAVVATIMLVVTIAVVIAFMTAFRRDGKT
jgi:putative spermidine/putrescine transport system permease protein